jgi:glyoxylase-like metal-dependent hydrolase (beta-lactamase superfamily II)
MRSFFAVAGFACLFVSVGSAQNMSRPMLEDNAAKVSDHVWVMTGFPNIAIVVGDSGTLVVDTGLGPRNGAVIAQVAQRLSKGSKLFLTTTHFHPEHAGGEAGFPANTILIRPAVQQAEMVKSGDQMVETFSKMNAQNAELLKGVKMHAPDVTFDSEAKIELGGGVTVRLLWFGAAHTKGDELIFVDPDKTLVSGDVVQNKVVPTVTGEGSASSWLAVLDKIAPLGARTVVPDHSPVGDGSLVAAERAFIADARSRALALKAQGVPADAAGKQMVDEFKAKYPDWANMAPLARFVQSIYAE